jgi:hypothetical protein
MDFSRYLERLPITVQQNVSARPLPAACRICVIVRKLL